MRRNAVVVGASRGLGLAFSEALLARDDVARVFASSRDPQASPDLARLRQTHGDSLGPIRLDVRDEESVASAARVVGEQASAIHLLIHCAGVLHDAYGLAPEKKLEDLSPRSLRRAFEVNAFGPLLVARHFFPLLCHEDRAVLANISARVGSIGDNRAGGWYAYRGSKAALNMFTRTLSIEMARRAPKLICVALHPGTVDTQLSKPFQRSVAADRLFEPKRAADQLLGVIDGLEPGQSGSFLAWDGEPIPW